MKSESEKDRTIIICIIGLFVVFVIAPVILLAPITIINPGQMGIIKLFGKLQPSVLKPGFHFINPLCSVIKMRTKFNQLSLTSSVLTEDNLTINVETTILYKLNPKKLQYIYSNLSDNIKYIEKSIIKPSLHSAIREASSTMDWDTLSIHREKLKTIIRQKLNLLLKQKGFLIKNVMINDISPPQKIKDAVMAKLKTQQEVMQMTFEQQKAKKEAQIKIIEAQGIAKAQRIIQKRLTPLYVQYYAIQAYKLLANNKNTTFVVLPTNPHGAGLPLILNTEKH